MVSLWGSKNTGDESQEASSERHQNDGSRGNADHDDNSANERSRLLAHSYRPPPRSDGYLDPDDPAVSPYNLWTVRFISYVTVVFLAVTFLWWVLLLVSIFISPPGMHSRGSGFFDFSYTTLTVGNLLVALLFFKYPSRAMRVSIGIIATILLVDVILIASIRSLRLEEGWVGIAAVAWAATIAVWCFFTDRVVAWGKREEEERLTGRSESRRTLKEWLGVFAGTVVWVAYILIALLMTATLIIRTYDASLPMEGNRYYVDGGKYQVHLTCVGEIISNNSTKIPTVLLEGAEEPLEYDLEHWAYAAYQNKTIPRYCYWDRPGYAWSDNAPSPHSAGMSADALSEALAQAGEEGPWILVSAGYGSIVSRIFSARHLRDVQSLLLVDPLHEDLLYRVGRAGRGFAIWGWGIISPLGISRLIGTLFGGQTRNDRVYGRSAKFGGKLLKAKLQENLVANSLSRHDVVSARAIQGKSIPIAIISSGIETRRDREWERKQEDLLNLSDHVVSWDIVKKAPHFVWKTFEGRQIMEKRLGELFNLAQDGSLMPAAS